jgi:hypothetical protein
MIGTNIPAPSEPAAGGSKTLSRFAATDNQPTAVSFATLDTRNNVAVLDFDDTVNEFAVFLGGVPEGADLSSGIVVRLKWTATTATSGTVRWGAEIMNLDTSIATDSFDTATEANGTTAATSGIPNLTAITCANIDSLVAGDFFRLRVYRDSADTGNDTMTGDAELIAVEVRSAA